MKKAISLKQPWAWLVAKGYKPLEFRERPSSFRGECYIHASKTFDDKGYEWLSRRSHLPGVKEMLEIMWAPKIDPDFGALIGKMMVNDCFTVELANKIMASPWLTEAGDTLGKYVFLIKSPLLFPTERFIPCRGKVFPLFFDVEVGHAV